MKMRNLFLSAILLIAFCATRAQSPTHYNVVFIAIDDMADKVSFLGYPEVLTPNLQRLVSRSMIFTNAYTQYPVCNASRSAMLTGWRPDKTKVFNNSVRPSSVLPPDYLFLPQLFHGAGYLTERTGKIMHGLFESDCPWDVAFPPDGDDGNDNKGKNTATAEPGGTWWVQNADVSPQADSSITKRFVSELYALPSQPFFKGFGLHVHSPFNPNRTNWNKYGDPNVQDLLPNDKKGKTNLHYYGNGSAGFILPATPVNDRSDIPSIAFPTNAIVKETYEWKKTIHAYYGEVAQMDSYLGEIFNAFDSLHLWNNTIVVFWSDHGQHLGEHNGVWLKNTLFNESLHIPFVMYVPGKNPGICDKLIESVDIYPTLAELCNLDTTGRNLEGSSFAKLFDDPTLPWKRAVFGQVKRGNITGRSVVSERYHYNSWSTSGEELYDRTTDPNEWVNQINNPLYAAARDSLRLILSEGWQASRPLSYSLSAFFRDADGDGYGNPLDTGRAYQQPVGYVTNTADCNDGDSAIHPGATELCDGIDNNCDGTIDEGLLSVFYRDADGDGYGSETDSIFNCEDTLGFSLLKGDCNDIDSSVHPGAEEICGDGIDNNCNGEIDENVPWWYLDVDGDGYGSNVDSISQCEMPLGYTAGSGDCNDLDSSIHPGVTEVCDDIDNNCDGVVDEGLLSLFYLDRDGDGYGNNTDSMWACSPPTGYVPASGDCNDTTLSIYPDAPELCDGIDNNCDGTIDEGLLSVFYRDLDGDGYGSNVDSTIACVSPSGYVTLSGDCNDSLTSVHVGATELCDGIDNDCDGLIDEGLLSLFYRDMDGDGYGSKTDSIAACVLPTGFVTNKLDCNDGSATAHPGARELCSNSVDDDCDGLIDEKPTASISAQTTNLCLGPVTLVAHTNDDSVTYVWRKDGSTIPGQTGSTYNPTTTGSYKIIITTLGGCQKTSSATVVTNSCRKGSTVAVTPNPSKGSFSLSFESVRTILSEIRIDIGGKQVLSKKISVVKGKNTVSMHTSLSPGVYTLSFYIGSDMYSSLLCIQ